MTNNNTDELIQFADESEPLTVEAASARPWRILVVDDDEQVHSATEFALSDVTILGRPLFLLHAYGAQDARSILATAEDIAVVFLDVVMEKEDSGLKLVHVIREELGLREVRIILRTGQPGYAPELQAIRDYDINDYRNKSELTITRLVTSLTSAIRSYEQIRALSYSRQGLEKIIRAASDLFEKRALESMAEGVLIQIAGLLGFPPNGVVCAQRGFPIDGSDQEILYVIGAVGKHSHAINQPLNKLGDQRIEQAINEAINRQQSLYSRDHTVLYLKSGGREEAVYLESDKTLDPLDQQLLEVFAANISVGFSNVYLFHRLNFLAYNDPVTGLPNRRRLVELIDLMKAENQPSEFLTILADVDHFSAINDVFGTSLGDFILRSIAERMQSAMPAGCHIGRYSGDTLCIIGSVTAITPEAVLDVFNEPFDVSGYIMPISVTVGACSSFHGSDGQAITKNAGLALNRAKQTQRGHYLLYQEEMSAETRYHLDMLQSLRLALNENQFELHYQPQLDVESGQVVGAEALLRWTRTDGQSVPPVEFIPVAEHSGLIVELGAWVLQEACRQLSRWNAMGLTHLRLAINVSTQQLKSQTFANLLKTELSNNGLPPGQLELEITESIIMDDLELAIHCLNQFKQMGVQVALDDFGTGFSSLSYLQRLPIDTLKVDRAFIHNIGQQGHGEKIAEMIVALSKLLELSTVAEGIETEAQLAATRAWGCRVAQGFLFAPAMKADDFIVWVQQHTNTLLAAQ